MTFQIDIRDEEMFKREIMDTPNVLQVMEVYNEWCGPSKAINNTCKKLYFEQGDRGLKFYTVSAGALQATSCYRGQCKPAFHFYRNGREIEGARLVGINAPKLTSNVLQELDKNR